MANDVEERLEAFWRDTSDEELFEYMEKQIQDLDNGRLQKAQFMAAYRNHERLKETKDLVKQTHNWVRFGSLAFLGLSGSLLAVVL